MPPKKRAGMTGIYVELPDELLAEFEGFVDGFPVGTKAQHFRLALRRHMDAPPEIRTPALQPATMEGEPKKGAGGAVPPAKKGKAK